MQPTHFTARPQASRCLAFFFVALALFAAVSLRAYDNGAVPVNTPASARLMINDLIETYGEKYPNGTDFLRRLDALEKSLALDQSRLDALIREAALANPVLDFDKILCIRRKSRGSSGAVNQGTITRMGFTELNAYTNDTIARKGWDNEVVVLSNLRGTPRLTPLYRHPDAAILRDLDLHFDAQKFLFASINKKGDWAVFEKTLAAPEAAPRELTPRDQPGIQWFDPCYLPEDNAIVTFSTAGIQGIPCVNGSQKVAGLYRIENAPAAAAPRVRQLTFEQDSGWHPRVLNDGRVMYLRWQYTDTPHYFDRMLFTMLPDGRQQKALWGSGAFFPTAYKHVRPVPGHPSLLLGVVSGHHSLPEVGRLMLVDPTLGTHYPFRHDPETKEWGTPGTHLDIRPRVYPKEVTGCVQEIPGHARDVVGNVYDNQGGDSKYTYATPYPLNEKYYLVSLWRDHAGTFGLWLVDRFDNMVKLYDLPDAHLFEPIPLQARKRPPVIPAVVNTDATEGSMAIADIYHGRGLPGIPRGTVKALRIYSYHFAYWRTGGYKSVGEESSWDIKRVLGTVPIEEDGSVHFKVPANTPIAIQALDADGAAVQIMQSWTICQPGETISCTGCHENPLSAPPSKPAIALLRPPRAITPWQGAPRPFAYPTEIQPLLDRNCVGCHNDTNKAATRILSFTANGTGDWHTDTSYQALHPYVRRPGPESDIATKTPMDFHASTSELIQRLRRGHYGVQLDGTDWERLYTWIDLNAPYRGAWNSKLEPRRLELQKLYGGTDANPEAEYRAALAALQANPTPKQPPVPPEKIKALLKHNDDGIRYFHASIGPLPRVHGDSQSAPAWPFSYTHALQRQKTDGTDGTVLDIPLPPDGTDAAVATSPQSIRFRRIPAGHFVIGSIDGFSDERPRAPVHIAKPFWIAETEITNAQYAAFDPDHDTGYEGENGMDHVTPGYIANHPKQPVARISWQQAMAYCEWLSKKTGKKVTLPTEAQWEWAARAGTDQAFYFGHRFSDFSFNANLADAGLRKTDQHHEGNTWDGRDLQRPLNYISQRGSSLIKHRRYFPPGNPYPLRDDRFEDKWFTVDYVKQYTPNAWGLYDVIGNVWEWTRTDYAPYPYRDDDGRNNGDLNKKKVVRGGSHADRPKVVGSAVRVPYAPWQRVHNVGFRPIIEEK